MQANTLQEFNSYTDNKWQIKIYDERQAELIGQKFEVSNLIAKLFSIRNISIDDIGSYLNPTLKDNMPDPNVLMDMDKACERILIALKNNEKIANVSYHRFLNNLENYENTDKNILGYKIKPGDKISVLSPSYQDYQSVFIEGEVNFPGKYTLKTKNDNLASLVKRAGGITDYANPDASVFIRNGQRLNIEFGKILKNLSGCTLTILGAENILEFRSPFFTGTFKFLPMSFANS